ncbi:G domain-containing protein [Mycena venus]|uniref:G domain-containing protein n=1 Tax=Mycena venus TaxID=2733690 RepID=A0A8H6Y4X8_9AGAR|nr:G domain-containing protein [Mycena venus]
MPPEPLVPETERILRDCPQFRVLVVGKSGAGKSSLIGHTFGIDVKSVSTDQRGKCNIYTEIHSPQNSRFVLHDSMGFEPGNVKNLQNVKDFISERSGANVPLKERVHAIWLCIQVPRAGGRAFETGDEEIVEFMLTHKVPVVVVFTQHDKLLSMINFKLPEPGRTPEEIHKLCAEKAQPIFQECCVAPLTQLSARLSVEISWVCTSGGFFGCGDGDELTGIYTGLSEKRPNPDRAALYELVNTTCNLVQKDMGLDASIVYAMAQRASAELKINTCVEVGMKRYWAGLASSAHFPGRTLQKCLETVHKEMTESWNFYDPDDVLSSLVGSCLAYCSHLLQHLVKVKFMDQVKLLAQLATADETEAKSWFKSEDLEAAQTWIGLAGATLAASAGPVIGALGVTAWFAKFVADLYYDTPETLRCFMAYLIDLTLVLHELFYVLPIASPRTVSGDNIALAFERYENSDLGRVHSEVRRYVSAGDWEREAAEKKMKNLILYYSSPEHRARRTAN